MGMLDVSASFSMRNKGLNLALRLLVAITHLCALGRGIDNKRSGSESAPKEQRHDSCDMCESYSFVFLFATGRSGVRVCVSCIHIGERHSHHSYNFFVSYLFRVI